MIKQIMFQGLSALVASVPTFLVWITIKVYISSFIITYSPYNYIGKHSKLKNKLFLYQIYCGFNSSCALKLNSLLNKLLFHYYVVYIK